MDNQTPLEVVPGSFQLAVTWNNDDDNRDAAIEAIAALNTLIAESNLNAVKEIAITRVS